MSAKKSWFGEPPEEAAALNSISQTAEDHSHLFLTPQAEQLMMKNSFKCENLFPNSFVCNCARFAQSPSRQVGAAVFTVARFR